MTVALLTCARLPNLTPADQLLIPELAKHNITAQAVVWDDPTIDWSDFDYLIFRNTWDYYEKESQFNFWLEKLQFLGIKTFNPLALIEHNKHKFYLQALQQKGIAVIPTVFIEKTAQLELATLLPPEWEKAVIKPAFSAGSYHTKVFSSTAIEQINTEYRTLASKGDLLLQQYVPEITSLGETSFVFFNKKFSHAINKKPTDGDFRIQVQFGGQYKRVFPDQEVVEQAQSILNNFSGPLLYARVDGIVIGKKIQLMEVECIEPDLYFNYCPGALEEFVASFLDLIK